MGGYGICGPSNHGLPHTRPILHPVKKRPNATRSAVRALGGGATAAAAAAAAAAATAAVEEEAAAAAEVED